MKSSNISRREFIQTTLTASSGLLIGAGCASTRTAKAKRTAVDQVTLGNTGVKLSRLGMGTGSNSGQIQRDLGKEGFAGLVHYAYDQGITYFDCSQTYRTFDWLGDAIKGLPREKIFLLSKIPGQPENILQV